MKIAQVQFDQIQQQAAPNFNFSYANLGAIISNLLPYIFTFAGLLLLVYLIFGGFQYMLSRGDQKAVESAKSHITNALIGFVIVFVAFWIVQIFGLIFNLQGITNIFGSK